MIDVLMAYVPLNHLQHLEDVTVAISESVRMAMFSDNEHVARRFLPLMVDRIWPLESASKDEKIHQLLMLAVESDSKLVAKLLLDSFGADVNGVYPPHHTTPLYRSASLGHKDMLLLLIDEYAADVHIASGKFANGPTALAIAIQNQHEDAIRALLDRGGPVETMHSKIKMDTTKRLFVSVATTLRYPVKLSAGMDPEWDVDGCTDAFLCLEFPDGWAGDVENRREDANLKDLRQLRTVHRTVLS